MQVFIQYIQTYLLTYMPKWQRCPFTVNVTQISKKNIYFQQNKFADNYLYASKRLLQVKIRTFLAPQLKNILYTDTRCAQNTCLKYLFRLLYFFVLINLWECVKFGMNYFDLGCFGPSFNSFAVIDIYSYSRYVTNYEYFN